MRLPKQAEGVIRNSGIFPQETSRRIGGEGIHADRLEGGQALLMIQLARMGDLGEQTCRRIYD